MPFKHRVESKQARTTDGPPRLRRRYVLRLRSLMIVVLLVGGVLGWKARRASIQRRAVAAINEVGGFVVYDYQRPGGVWKPATPHWAPDWLRRPIGDEYFQEPTMVALGDSTPPSGLRPNAATIDAIARLDRVDFLQTYRVPIVDADFVKLAAMPRLSRVSLLDIDVTDEGLASLASSPAMESLTLRGRPGAITSRGLEAIGRQARIKNLGILNIELPDPASLAPLAKLTRLESLRLWGSPPDDACLVHLRGLTELQILDLRQTKLTDSGLDQLAGMDKLEALLIDCSKLTDAGLAKLATHTALRELWVQPSTKLSDGGLISLGKVRSVTELNLPGANVTDAGLDLLRNLKLATLAVSGPGLTDAGLAVLVASNQFHDLGLSGTGVTGQGMAALAGQAQLRSLALDRSKFDDDGAATIASLPSLEILVLAETSLTDAGLAILQQAPRITYLDLHGTQVTDAGLAAFRKARPGVTVDSGSIP